MTKVTVKDCMEWMWFIRENYPISSHDRHICNRIIGILEAKDQGLIIESGQVIVNNKVVGERG